MDEAVPGGPDGDVHLLPWPGLIAASEVAPACRAPPATITQRSLYQRVVLTIRGALKRHLEPAGGTDGGAARMRRALAYLGRAAGTR